MTAPELLNDAFDKLADWDRRPSKASSARLDKAIRLVLAAMLQRQPTDEEVNQACK